MSSLELEAVEKYDSDESYVVQNQNGSSRGEAELQKKLRSVKLAKSPSRRRRSKNRSNDATADIAQNSGRVLVRRSSFKPVSNLTRMSSVKLKNNLVRKTTGSSSSSSPSFLKETCCSSERRNQIQGSLCCSSESSCCSTSNSTPNSAHKSARLSRTRSKTRSIRKQSEISEFPGFGVQRATCSSALKHSKSPPEVKDVNAEGCESEGASATKPCPFTYCSLHGHRHTDVPPLKRLISIRRRLLKAQRGTKLGTRSTVRVNKSGKIKEDGMNQMVSNGHDQVHGTTSPVVDESGLEDMLQVHDKTCSKEDEYNYDLPNVSEKLCREILEESPQETSDLATVEQHALVSPTSLDNLCLEGHCIEPASEVTNTYLKEETCAASSHNECIGYTCADKLNSLSPKSIPENMEIDYCTNVELHDEVVESTSENESQEKSCSSSCRAPEEQTIAIEQKDVSLVTDKVGSVELDNDEGFKCSMQAKNHKYITMWRLMYKHAVKGNPAVLENPLHGDDKEDKVEGTTAMILTSKPSFCETDEHTVSTNNSEGDQTLELCQQNAIDLVQEAFDKILLPEIQDSIYDDQSVTSDICLDQDGLQLRNDGGEEHRTLTSGESSEYRMVHDTEETQLEAENSNDREEKAVEVVENKFEQNTPKRWSSLKKFILLKRFVKAIEKVRNPIFRKPHFLPLDPDSEAEKINLRRLALKHSKSADEWMLDYALQKVISMLAPPQQRRVALLVEAFETVLPFPASGATDDDQQRTHSIKTRNEEGRIFTANDDTELPSVSTSESKGPQLLEQTCLKQEEKVLENKTGQEICTEHISVSSLDFVCMNSNVESDGETSKLNTNCNGAESELSEDMELKTAREGSNGGETNGNFGSAPLEESNLESNAHVPQHVTQLEKQNYTRLWYFVYKHMVSSVAEKDGDDPPDGADEGQGNDSNTLPQVEMNPTLSLTSQQAVNKKNELRRIETIKLVEQKLDEILLPESQEESEDDLANTMDSNPDQEPPEDNICKEGKSFTTFSNFAKDSFRVSKKKAGVDPEDKFIASDNSVIKDEDKEVLMVEEKPKQKLSKNWRNLKRMILLNRFIKALEKGRKSIPRGPKYLLLEPDPEAEKVNLKHQNIDDRKNAEEWMLDYALQKAVAKLTPARNRKVALLVEAFETVIPTKGIPNPFKPEVFR